MPVLPLNNLRKSSFMLLYGPAAVGKTTSILASCDLPAEYCQIEMRGLADSIEVANQIRASKGLPLITADNFTIYLYDDYDTFTDYYAAPRETYPKTLILDSLSHLMITHLMTETEDQAHASRVEQLQAAAKGKPVEITKNIASQNKQTEEGYGLIASATGRITNIFGFYAANGTRVIFTALEDERSRMIDNKVMRVPLFAGKAYLKIFTSYFDLIGRVVPRTDKEGKKLVYPPGVRFESPAGDFVARWAGVGDKRDFLLDLQEIKPGKEKV